MDPQIRARIDRVFKSLMRHRERYVKAWCAWSGVHVRDAVLIQQTLADGNGVRIWVQRKSQCVEFNGYAAHAFTDHGDVLEFLGAVRKLVYAARAQLGLFECDCATCDDLRAALRGFEET